MTLEPGIYEDVPFADYLAWEAVSNSRLSLMAKSPRHYKTGFCKEPTPSMRLGQLYHCGVLEPRAFMSRYAVCPDYHLYAENSTVKGDYTTSRNTVFVKESVREFTAMAEGREVVPKDWYLQTLGVVRELALNADANRILNAEGPNELSILWDEDGILCKARFDKAAYGMAIADLKSTASLDGFTNTIGRFAYHRQMAHYQTGWKELTGDTLPAWIIAFESSEPFPVQAAPMSPESMEIGYGARRRLMDTLRDCLEADHWPPMENPKQWNVPAWCNDNSPVELLVNGQSIEV